MVFIAKEQLQIVQSRVGAIVLVRCFDKGNTVERFGMWRCLSGRADRASCSVAAAVTKPPIVFMIDCELITYVT